MHTVSGLSVLMLLNKLINCASSSLDIVVTISYRTDERRNEKTGQPKNIMPSLTLSGDEGYTSRNRPTSLNL